jgi:2-dehydro-3-deoxyphosphogluconate aldolase/(4S)-4-hydroxy-2-oxoglutarate aldolase
MNTILQKLLAHPIVPVFTHADAEYAQRVLHASYEGGIRVFEFTNRKENAFDTYRVLKKYAEQHCPDLMLGIGTIYTAAQAEQFIEVGTDFIVQPVTTAEVGEVCKKHTLPWIPGVLTTTEIYQATVLGAEIVKLFPGNVVGSGYVKALRGPMPDVKIMVTGGVEPTEASLREWFGAGVNCVGMGSQLFNTDDMEELKKRIQTLMTFLSKL